VGFTDSDPLDALEPPMSTSQYVLNLGLLALILVTNLGTHPLTRRRMLLPVALVAVAGYVYLRDLPTLGNDTRLELAGLTLGAVLGVVAALLVVVGRGSDGRVVTTAGAAFATLWVVVIGGRVLFAYGAEHWFGPAIGRFSHIHEITGGDAWTAAFVLMALAMVVTRVLVTGAQATRIERPRPALAG
jgi:hypothetical protein